MIAVKDHGQLFHLLMQEELVRAIANLYTGMTKEAQIKKLYADIIKASEQNSKDMLAYLKSNV